MKKREEEKIKNIEKSYIMKRQKKMEEYKNKLKMTELEEKNKKIEDFYFRI